MESVAKESEESGLLERVADALLVLANVGFGDYSGRLEVGSDEEGPLASLFVGINEMIDALGPK